MTKVNEMGSLEQRFQKWEALAAQQKERRQSFETDSGLVMQRLYTPLDIRDVNYIESIGFPGEYPYVRGPYPTMYRTRHWTMRQVSGLATGEETNARLKYMLSIGQTGLNVVLDMPTHRGYDSDHPLAEGEVGRCGVAVDSLADMEDVFRDIPLDGVSISLIANATAPIIMAMYIAIAQKRGIPLNQLSGSVQNDVLKEYTGVGTGHIFPPGPALKMAMDIIEFCAKNMPHWNSITINAHCMRENGITAVQEAGFSLASAVTYLEAGIARGMSVDDFAQRISFHVAADGNFLEEVAKFRAMRGLWANILRGQYGASDPRTWMVRFSAQTAGRTLMAHEPENNIVRTTIQALAAVLGGVQSIHTNGMDEALGIPSEQSARIALRTQQIIAYESGVAETVDALGGSYCIERITSQIMEQASAVIKVIKDHGGVIAAIEKGWYAAEISRVNRREDQAIQSGEKVIVGVNRFQDTGGAAMPMTLCTVDEESERRQRERVKAIRASRDPGRVAEAVKAVRRAAEAGDNLIPSLIEAVTAYATVGELSDELRAVYGEYREPIMF
jgi:methylmalonyl-CoA mutase N-terminal domain/subunit